MKYEEALKTIRYEVDEEGHCGYIEVELRLAIAALEKQIPKKPVGDLNSVPHYRCAACGNGVKTYEDSTVYPYCHYCGQKLLWGSDTK